MTVTSHCSIQIESPNDIQAIVQVQDTWHIQIGSNRIFVPVGCLADVGCKLIQAAEFEGSPVPRECECER